MTDYYHFTVGKIYRNGQEITQAEYERAALQLRIEAAMAGGHGAAQLLEQDVKELGLSNHYTLALFEIVNGVPWGPDVTLDEMFLMANATPDQRARAFVEVAKQI